MKKLFITFVSSLILSTIFISTSASAYTYGNWQLVKDRSYSYQEGTFKIWRTVCTYKRDYYGVYGKVGEEWRSNNILGKGIGNCYY